jgi:hypothetical protein
MIRKAVKIIGWTAAGIAALGVAAYLIAVAINWRDQEPSSEAVQLANLYRDRPAVADEDNAFIYVMGFGVAPGDDPYRMGVKRLAWLMQSSPVEALDTTRDPLGERYDYKTTRPPSIRDFVAACQPGKAGCAAAFRAGGEVYEQWVTAEGWLLQRYQALIGHSGWRESVPLNLAVPLPPYALVMDGQKLLLLDAKVLAGRGDYSGARVLLEEDLRFWRKVLESSDTLISRMIATVAITRDFELGNLIMREVRPAVVMDTVPTGWSTPISESERSMRRCLVGEWIFMSAALRNTDAGIYALRDDSAFVKAVSWLVTPLYRPQDSMNRRAAYLLATDRLLSVPLDRYEEAVNRTAALSERTMKEALPPRSLYNIVGRVIMGIGAYDFGTYARRVGDVEGVRRAALLAVTLRAANVGSGEAGAALRASALRDPYRDKPFEWDGKEAAIIFRGLEIGERSVHRIYY